jgi:two-component system chemotaxis response regulator CheY
MTTIITRIVSELGYEEIHTAHSGAEALQKMRTKDFGLVICELNMHPMDGLELAFCIRQDSQLRKAAIVLTTADAKALAQTISTEHFKLVDACLMKPFTANQLATRLSGISVRSSSLKKIRPRSKRKFCIAQA